MQERDSNALLYPDGKILLVPPMVAAAFCNMDFTYWPFDEHICILKFGSWTYDGYTVDLMIYDGQTTIV
jgi:nicotinic acetylcholine receptor